MSSQTFEHLSRAIAGRSPTVAAGLQPGLSEEEIRRTLGDVGVPGTIESLVALYGWRNGCKSEPSLSLSECSLFPNSNYQFLPFRSAVGHYCRIAAYSPKFAHIFAAFRCSDDCWLAFNTEPGTRCEVVHFHLFDPEFQTYAAYATIDEFVLDLIRCNEQNSTLECFLGF